MTQTEDFANTDPRPGTAGELSDEDLEAVTGGLMRPLAPSGPEDHRIGSGSDAGHEDTTDA